METEIPWGNPEAGQCGTALQSTIETSSCPFRQMCSGMIVLYILFNLSLNIILTVNETLVDHILVVKFWA